MAASFVYGKAMDPQVGSRTFDTPVHQAGDLMIVYFVSIETQSASYPVMLLTGWTRALPTVNAIYAGRFPVSFDVFTRVATASEPSTYTITSSAAAEVSTATASVRGETNYRISSATIPSSMEGGTGYMDFPSMTTVADTLVLLLGGTPQAGPDAWCQIVPAGTSPANVVPANSKFGSAHYVKNTSGPTGTNTVLLNNTQAPAAAYTMVFEPSGPPTLNTLTLSKSSVYVGSANGTIVGSIQGGTAGSILEVTPSGGTFIVSGNNLVVNTPPPTAGPISVVIKETLAGATNSPNTTTVVVNVEEQPPIQFIKAASGVATGTIEDLNEGDLIIVFSYRDGSASAPPLPAGFTDIRSGTAVSQGYRVGYKWATQGSNSLGSWGQATSIVAAAYRSKPYFEMSIGNSTSATAVSTTVNYPAFTLQNTNGTSWITCMGAHRAVNTSIETPPAGMVNRISVVDTTDEMALHDTNGGVETWASTSVPVGGTSSGWMTAMVEIKVTDNTPPPSGLKAHGYTRWL